MTAVKLEPGTRWLAYDNHQRWALWDQRVGSSVVLVSADSTPDTIKGDPVRYTHHFAELPTRSYVLDDYAVSTIMNVARIVHGEPLNALVQHIIEVEASKQ